MPRKFFALILITIIMLNITLASCGTNESTDQINYYTLEGSASLIDSLIYEYNEYCGEDNKINVTEFSDEKALSNAISTEIMAGKGPDIISLNTLSYSSVSFDKLLQQGTFADINAIINNDSSDNKFNFENYNENIINACVFEGKLVLMPISYLPNVLISTEEKRNSYINNQSLDYKTVVSINEDLTEYSFFEYEDEYESLFYDYIDDNVDLYNNITSFNTDEFLNTAKGVKSIMINTYDKESLCTSSDTFSLLFTCENFMQKINNGETPILLNNPSNDGEYTADICEAVAVNSNTSEKKQQKILEFIKYILSDTVQNDFCGADTEKLDDSLYSGMYYPVNKAAFDKLFSTAKELLYTENETKIDYKLVKYIQETINKIDNYQISMTYDYYNNNVINDTVSKYLNDNLSEEEFVNQLKSKTEIYLEE